MCECIYFIFIFLIFLFILVDCVYVWEGVVRNFTSRGAYNVSYMHTRCLIKTMAIDLFCCCFCYCRRCSCRRRRRCRFRRRCCLAWLYFVFTQHSLSWHMIFAIQCLYYMAISLFATRTNRLCITRLVHIYIYIHIFIQHKQSTKVLAMTIKTFTQMSNFVYALYGFSSFIFFFHYSFSNKSISINFQLKFWYKFLFQFFTKSIGNFILHLIHSDTKPRRAQILHTHTFE